MKKLTRILTGANSKAGSLRSLRLIFGMFMALLLPLSQAANFAHVIIDNHGCQYHGNIYSTNGSHLSTPHSDSEHHDHPAHNSSEPGHHTVSDHMELFHVWKPSSKIVLPTLIAVLVTHFEAFATIPRAVDWPRDEKQYWPSLLYGQPPQLRAPPTYS